MASPRPQKSLVATKEIREKRAMESLKKGVLRPSLKLFFGQGWGWKINFHRLCPLQNLPFYGYTVGEISTMKIW